MQREKTPYYAVTVSYAGKRYFAVRGHKPQVVYPIEKRCVFKEKRIANDLLRFLNRESTFKDIRMETRYV